jgi:hypothetical protein
MNIVCGFVGICKNVSIALIVVPSSAQQSMPLQNFCKGFLFNHSVEKNTTNNAERG